MSLFHLLTSRGVRSLFAVTGGIVGIAIFVWMIRLVALRWTDAGVAWSRIDLLDVMCSFVLLLLSYLSFATAWHKLAVHACLDNTWTINVARWGLSLVGKYAPGKIWHATSRVALYANADNTAGAVAAFIVEFILSMVAAAALTAILLWIASVPLPLTLWVLPLLLLCILLICACSPLVRTTADRFVRTRRTAFAAHQLPIGLMAGVIAWHLLAYALMCAGFVMGCWAIHVGGVDLVWILCGGLLLGGISGAIAFAVPVGLGVREGALAWVLSHALPPATAILIAILARTWLLAGEATAVAAGAAFLRSRRVRSRKS